MDSQIVTVNAWKKRQNRRINRGKGWRGMGEGDIYRKWSNHTVNWAILFIYKLLVLATHDASSPPLSLSKSYTCACLKSIFCVFPGSTSSNQYCSLSTASSFLTKFTHSQTSSFLTKFTHSHLLELYIHPYILHTVSLIVINAMWDCNEMYKVQRLNISLAQLSDMHTCVYTCMIYHSNFKAHTHGFFHFVQIRVISHSLCAFMNISHMPTRNCLTNSVVVIIITINIIVTWIINIAFD